MAERDVEREEELKDKVSVRDQLRGLLQQLDIPASEAESDLQEDLGLRQLSTGLEIPPPTEEMLVLGRTHYMLKDNDLRNIVFEKHRWLIPAYLALSHLLRTSNFDPWDIEPMKWRYKRVIDLLLMCKEDLTPEDIAMAEVMYMHGISALKDALEGWRGKLVTEHVRTYRIEGERVEKDRRRWWERIFGR